MALTLASFISPADAQKKAAKTTAATSPQCFWVVESWKKMGKTTSVSSTSATACCNYLVSSTGTTTTQTSGIRGVTCTSDGIVTKISWWDQGLVNSIPADLGRLTSLTHLNLGNNWLGGSIPPAIGNLVKLEFLDFYRNGLTGSIPPELGNFTNLQYLGMASNQLSGPIPSSWGNFSKLTLLGIWGNKFTGSIPPELGQLVNLQSLELSHNQLSGQIPTSFGQLVNLRGLSLADTQLSGPIPSSLGNLVKLESIWLFDNEGLNGTFTPQCQTTSGAIPHVWITGTNVTICGCLSSSTPPTLFPPPGTPDACLATGPALTLSKRILAFSQVIGSYTYTCNTDANNNPYADCLNSMAKICNTADSSFDKTRCQTGVNTMFGMMNNHWQRVRKQCGQWSFTLNGITYPADPSDNCNSANTNLIANAIYIHNGVQVRVTSGLTESIKVQLWSNALLA